VLPPAWPIEALEPPAPAEPAAPAVAALVPPVLPLDGWPELTAGFEAPWLPQATTKKAAVIAMQVRFVFMLPFESRSGIALTVVAEPRTARADLHASPLKMGATSRYVAFSSATALKSGDTGSCASGWTGIELGAIHPVSWARDPECNLLQ
jgi:hypothetical protein